MNSKFAAILTIGLFITLASGYFFTSKVNKEITPEINGFDYEVTQDASACEAHFKGTFTNPRDKMVNNVTIFVYWNEADGEEHIESMNLGNVPGKSNVEFDIVYERDYLIVIKSASPTFTLDEEF